MLEPERAEGGADRAERVESVADREDVLVAAGVGLDRGEQAGVVAVRDQPGAEADIAPFVRRPGAEPAAGLEDSGDLRGEHGGVVDMLEDRITVDQVDARILEREDAAGGDAMRLVHRVVAEDDRVDVEPDHPGAAALQGRDPLEMPAIFGEAVAAGAEVDDDVGTLDQLVDQREEQEPVLPPVELREAGLGEDRRKRTGPGDAQARLLLSQRCPDRCGCRGGGDGDPRPCVG